MPGDRSAAEARFKPLQKGLGQGDFGKQHQRLLPLAQAFGNRFEIDFRLAGARDSVEQDWIEPLSDCATRGSWRLRVAPH